ncbi:hypothetical protein D3C72_2381550 [compost metagenome]
MGVLLQHLTERGGTPSGKVAVSVRCSGCAGRRAFTECVVDDHVIADQDVECFLRASSRHLHGNHVALSMG